jgi:uncharacterized protein
MDTLLEIHQQAIAAHPNCRPFWEATKREQLLLPLCDLCKAWHWYPRSFCPFCYGDDVHWTAVTGRGRIYAFTSLLRDPQRKLVAYVELEEGPIMLTHIVDCSLDRLKINDPLEVCFEELPTGVHIPVFKLSTIP